MTWSRWSTQTLPCPAWMMGVKGADQATEYLNSKYRVFLRVCKTPLLYHLVIRRRDGKPLHSWHDLQRIKNELVGQEEEAVEVYPAESRLVDRKHIYHLWVLRKPLLIGPRVRSIKEST